MRTYLLKRLLLIPVTLLGISILSFVLIRASGDPASILIGSAISGNVRQTDVLRKTIIEWRHQQGLDLPWHRHYALWITKMGRLDFGGSWDDPSRTVMSLIAEKIPATLQINVISFVLIYLLAVPLGIFSAARSGTFLDRTVSFLLFVLYSLPSFWVGLLLIYGLGEWIPFRGLSDINADRMGPIPWLWDRTLHLLLPVFCLTYAELAALSRYMRSGMLEVLRQDYIRTARAKGLPERRVILRHALRNALIPIVTLMATILPDLIGGSVVIENLFSIDGMGRLVYTAILKRDLPVVMGTVVLSALLTLAGLLLADFVYVWINPTITFEKAETG